MTPTRPYGRPLALAAASLLLCAAAVRPARAQADPRQQGSASVSAKAVAAQLGIKLQAAPSDELDVGQAITGLLEDPEKLASFGLKDLHPGARVMVARMAPDRVKVEADELEPVEIRRSATIKLSAKGELTKPAAGDKPPS